MATLVSVIPRKRGWIKGQDPREGFNRILYSGLIVINWLLAMFNLQTTEDLIMLPCGIRDLTIGRGPEMKELSETLCRLSCI